MENIIIYIVIGFVLGLISVMIWDVVEFKIQETKNKKEQIQQNKENLADLKFSLKRDIKEISKKQKILNYNLDIQNEMISDLSVVYEKLSKEVDRFNQPEEEV